MKQLRIARDRAVKTTVEQTLMRGLVPHFRVFVRGCLYLPAGVDEDHRPHKGTSNNDRF
jgi:hypothetical protein